MNNKFLNLFFVQIKEGDQVTLLDPCFRNNNFSWNEKHYEFRSVRLDFLEQVQVNGKPVPPCHSVRSSIYAQHKP
ncbi:putative tetratricopeptide repeat protein 5, OB [Helianthus anomalus]